MANKFYLKVQNNSSNDLNNSGFSLLEVLMGVALLTIGMLATSALAVGIINGNSTSKHVSTAAVLAQEKIESIRQAGYSGLSPSDSSVTETSISYTLGGETVPYGSYTRITDVQVNVPMANMKTVTVRVFWGTGTNPLTTITTYIAQ